MGVWIIFKEALKLAKYDISIYVETGLFLHVLY
jgi:hypothetical protein